MINLLSTVDGFKVIMGGWIVNLAALMTLVLAIRTPPDYGDDTDEDINRTLHAKLIFSGLVLMHTFLCVVKYLSLHVTRWFWDLLVLLSLINIVIMIYICQRWLYIDDRDLSTLTDEQYKFQMWLWTELMLVYASIAGSAIYISVSYFHHPTFVICSTMDKVSMFGDFLDSHMTMVDFMNSIFSPGLIAIMIALSGASSMASEQEKFRAGIQSILFVI